MLDKKIVVLLEKLFLSVCRFHAPRRLMLRLMRCRSGILNVLWHISKVGLDLAFNCQDWIPCFVVDFSLFQDLFYWNFH